MHKGGVTLENAYKFASKFKISVFLLLTKFRPISIVVRHLARCVNAYRDFYASIAQSVERNHGKVEVNSSILFGGCYLVLEKEC